MPDMPEGLAVVGRIIVTVTGLSLLFSFELEAEAGVSAFGAKRPNFFALVGVMATPARLLFLSGVDMVNDLNQSKKEREDSMKCF